jgi:predicted nucleic acid-binding protein
MIIVDSSVWIDAFRNVKTPETLRLHSMLGQVIVGTSDLILIEVLQGTNTDREFDEVRRILTAFPSIDIAGQETAILAARNYRRLRSLGITIRKTIDTLIATRCIVDDHTLLFSDRDFEPFVTHLGLRSAMAEV